MTPNSFEIEKLRELSSLRKLGVGRSSHTRSSIRTLVYHHHRREVVVKKHFSNSGRNFITCFVVLSVTCENATIIIVRIIAENGGVFS